MGINGLLQGLKHYAVKGNVRDYSGQSLAVDTSSWLHKSVYSIADHYVEVVEQTGQADNRSIAVSASYIGKRCDELLTYAGIKRIYLVMDGKRCPLKAVTNDERDSRRQGNLEEARRYRAMNDKDKMYEKYKMCIKVQSDLSQAVAQAIARRFRDGRVQIVWAPYEADSQLAKLCVDGIAQAVVTEDSDVLVYSAACQVSFPILFKLDRNSGRCDVISMDWLLSAQFDAEAVLLDDKKKTSGLEPILQAFVTRQRREPGSGARLFVQSCVLAGCDYAPNELNGVGLVSAFKHVRAAIPRAPEDRFRHVLNLLPGKARKHVNRIDYEELLAKSEAVFYYHPVAETDGSVVFFQDPNAFEPNVFFPSLDRFGGDWSFLGQGGLDGVSVQPEVESAEPEFKPPVQEISVRAKWSKSRRHLSKRSTDASLLGFLKPAPRDRPRKEFVPVANPYQQQGRKRQREDGRIPLAESSPNKRAIPSDQFAQFAYRGKENRKSSNLSKYLDKPDVRFVKRTFSKESPSVRVKGDKPCQRRSPPKNTVPTASFDYDPVGPGEELGSQSLGTRTTDRKSDGQLYEPSTSQHSWPKAAYALGHQAKEQKQSHSPVVDLTVDESCQVLVKAGPVKESWRVNQYQELLGTSSGFSSADDSLVTDRRESLLAEILQRQRDESSRTFAIELSSTQGAVGNDPTKNVELAEYKACSEVPVLPSTSRFFASDRDVRRVTLPSKDPPRREEVATRCNVEQPSDAFEYYDDFLSSPETQLYDVHAVDDDIVDDSSPFFARPGVPMFQSRATAPRAQSTIGPAKTMRQRFGAIPMAFQKQRKQPGALSTQGKGPLSSVSRARKSSTSNRGSILFHFSHKK